MPTPWWILAIWAVTTIEQPGKASIWVDGVRFSPNETEVFIDTVAGMVRGKPVEMADRLENADLLLRLHLASTRAQTTVGEEARPSSYRLDPAEIEIDAPPTSAAFADVEWTLVDIVRDRVIQEKSLRCRLPLTERNRLQDPMLRASLSDATDVAERWVDERAPDPVPPAFGPSGEERRSLGPSELAHALRREAARALLRGYEETGLTLLADAQALYKQTGLRHDEGLTWERLAASTLSTGRPLETAVSYAEQAVKVARESSDSRAEARALVTLAVGEAAGSDYRRSLEVLQAAQRMARNDGDNATESVVLANIAALTAIRGRFSAALGQQEQALTLLEPGNARLETRLKLAMAVVQSHLDARDRAETLGKLLRLREVARQTNDLGLDRDLAFVLANVRFNTTDLAQLNEGELDAIRALRLSRRLGDRRGEAAALALLGAFSHKLLQPAEGAEYLGRALESARENGYVEITIDSLHLLGEMAPSAERGVLFLDDVLLLRRETGDLPGQIRTLSDQSRLLAGLGKGDGAWTKYREAVSVLGRYVEERLGHPFKEDIRSSFIDTLKTLVATRAEAPFLERYLEMRHLMITREPEWMETMR
ncbi:MAG TPA: hypothetical protein VLK65_10075 [Vicinamibacteria bacterium]|nr:hypothetical protein [Vicinamibacteria bacterium]